VAPFFWTTRYIHVVTRYRRHQSSPGSLHNVKLPEAVWSCNGYSLSCRCGKTACNGFVLRALRWIESKLYIF